MHLKEYQKRAAATDQKKNLRLSVLGLAGEAGSVLSTFKKQLRDRTGFTGFDDEMKEELGDLLWYISSIATSLHFDLEQIANQNLRKARSRWRLGPIRKFDETFPAEERLPRKFQVELKRQFKNKIGITAYIDGIALGQMGDLLSDNSYEHDGYRYHDVFHLAYAAVLGWSPVVRAGLRRKRKSDPQTDEVEDGARAKIIEEAISIHVFNNAKRNNLFEKTKMIDGDILKSIQELTVGLEVSVCTRKDWERAILTGY